MPRRPEVDPNSLETIRRAAVTRERSAAQVYHDLKDRYGDDQLKAPPLRTVQRWYKRFAPVEDTAAWALEDSEPADARHVLAVLREFPYWAAPDENTLSVALADWIARVAEAAPTLPYDWVGMVALAYRHDLAPRGDLDLFLASRCWESRERSDEYNSVIAAGYAKVPTSLRIRELAGEATDWHREIGTREAATRRARTWATVEQLEAASAGPDTEHREEADHG